ncbi:DUF2007 domain-containing protein [Flavobacterium arcticum]|uniref:DUF2007 domain-containing protein n=1 Tax=Flavobacterium arcticum TaxID=1784713 RepID=A0A345HAR2_9FLAO|nr:DUF2007 domain-containing protein [Flavobacterium arcticum]AXG73672.1 DUF2007 domain-containing protein [Flavobacterium arcticum]KAF2511622.1 DUF2007 domain-containing protein [Flavobacterium arcticum]
MKEFVTIAVFTYPHEIAILKHLLIESGINFFFENETMTAIVPMYSFALGGIKLKVHPNDIETVKTILKDFSSNTNLRIV